ncbi:MAG: ABC transporter permease [Bacillota bacterium]|jgi:oligopeptide transport system permease protein
MRRYIIQRLIISVITVCVIVTACFFLLRLLPGNPFASDAMLPQEIIDKMMRYYGMDKPLWQQYLTYMGNLLRGDFGYSLKYAGRSVNYVIATTFPISARLGLQSLLFSYPVGLLLGIISARRRGKPIDMALSGMTIFVISVPSFIIAVVLQYTFALKLGWLPAAGWRGFAYTILPTITMSLGSIASRTRSMRTLMLEVNEQDYLRTAKAKGLGEARIVVFHQIRNAIIPMISTLGMEIAGLLMGSFIVERIFNIPGMGGYFVNSINSLDYTMVLGLTAFSGTLIVAANFIVDLLYGVVDPRIRIT